MKQAEIVTHINALGDNPEALAAYLYERIRQDIYRYYRKGVLVGRQRADIEHKSAQRLREAIHETVNLFEAEIGNTVTQSVISFSQFMTSLRERSTNVKDYNTELVVEHITQYPRWSYKQTTAALPNNGEPIFVVEPRSHIDW